MLQRSENIQSKWNQQTISALEPWKNGRCQQFISRQSPGIFLQSLVGSQLVLDQIWSCVVMSYIIGRGEDPHLLRSHSPYQSCPSVMQLMRNYNKQNTPRSCSSITISIGPERMINLQIIIKYEPCQLSILFLLASHLKLQ